MAFLRVFLFLKCGFSTRIFILKGRILKDFATPGAPAVSTKAPRVRRRGMVLRHPPLVELRVIPSFKFSDSKLNRSTHTAAQPQNNYKIYTNETKKCPSAIKSPLTLRTVVFFVRRHRLFCRERKKPFALKLKLLENMRKTRI